MEPKKPHEAMGDAMRAQQDLHPRKSFMTSRGGRNPDGLECCLHYMDMLVTVYARAQDTGGAYGLVTGECPQGSGPPPHIHSREDEAFLVLSGHVHFWCGDAFYDCLPGSYVFLPRGVIHRFEGVGPGVSKVACIVSPGGQEQMFRLGGTPAAAAIMPAPITTGGYPIQRALEAGRATGVEFYPEHWGWIEQAKKRYGERKTD